MDKTLFGLKVEIKDFSTEQFYVTKNGGIQRHELGKHSLRMLEENVIPHVLTLDVEEHNLTMNLRYSYAGKRPLFHILKSQKLDEYEYLHLLYQLLTILSEASNYMLDECCFVFDDNYIFVDPESMTLYLTYVPLKEVPPEQGGKEQLVNIISTFSVYLDAQKQKRIEDLTLDYLQNKLNVMTLRQQLKEVINSLYLSTEDQIPTLSASGLADVQSDPLNQVEELDQSEEIMFPNTAETKVLLPPLTSRSKTYLYLTVLVLVALIWRGYLGLQQIESILYVCLALSFLVCSGAVVFQFLWRPKYFLPRSSESQEYEQSPSQSYVNEDRKQSHQLPQSMEQSRTSTNMDRSPISMDLYYQQLAQYTQMLVPTPETSLLANHPVNQTHLAADDGYKVVTPIAENDTLAYLTYMKVDQSETNIISIQSVPFIVGRDPELVNFVEKRLGVSRMHFEINVQNDEFFVKDLGSRNGTYLNGKRLVMHTSYPLHDMDLLQIASVELMFKRMHSV